MSVKSSVFPLHITNQTDYASFTNCSRAPTRTESGGDVDSGEFNRKRKRDKDEAQDTQPSLARWNAKARSMANDNVQP